MMAGFLAAAFTVLGGCETVQTTSPGAVGIDREQTMLVSSEEVDKGAAQAYAQELTKARQKGTLNKNQKDVEQVRRVTDRLIRQVGVFRTDALQWDWKINVESSKELNAYCMPGGKIMVYTGLIDKLELSDAELGRDRSRDLARPARAQPRAHFARLRAADRAARRGGRGGRRQPTPSISRIRWRP